MEKSQTTLQKYLAKHPKSIRVFVNDEYIKIKELYDVWKSYCIEHQVDKKSKEVISTRRQLFDKIVEYAKTDYFDANPKVTWGFYFSTKLDLAVFVIGNSNYWLEGNLGTDIEDMAMGEPISGEAESDVIRLREFGLTCSVNAIRINKECSDAIKDILLRNKAKVLAYLDKEPWENFEETPEPEFTTGLVETFVVEHPNNISNTDYCRAFSQDFMLEQERVMLSANSNKITLLPSEDPYILNTCGLDTLICPYDEDHILEVKKQEDIRYEYQFTIRQIKK